MKITRWFVMTVFMASLFAACTTKTGDSPRLEQDFNQGWKFALIDEDASATNYDDAGWRDVKLPHDWSIEFSYDSVHGEGATAYLLGGIGWYRKDFKLDFTENEKVYIYFDGVYNNSETYVNGTKLGFHPYGYSPFYFDVTEYINSGEEINVAVKVDHSAYADSRWYTGSGIYRNVTLIKTNKLSIPVWGTFVTTPEVSKEAALVNVKTDIENALADSKKVSLKTEVIDADGKVVASKVSEVTIAAGEKVTAVEELTVDNPQLWGIENPYLYSVVSTVSDAGVVVDKYETVLGIRTFKFDADKGFFLNGENMKIKGVNLHHDGGLVGSAVPKGVWKRRLELLKEGGCNALRISHNPASEELLDLADEMGFLVQDEFFDEWDNPKDKRLNMWLRVEDSLTKGYTHHFPEWAEKDLKSVMLAHRNHPSIFQWSIGNEIEWTYDGNAKATGFFGNMDWSGNYFWSQPPYGPEEIRANYEKLKADGPKIGETAQKLADWTREMDTTRPVIANCILPSASFETGYADALDIVGFSYRRVMYDYAKEHYPNKIVMGTENLGQYHEWKAIMERDFVSGTYLWTGVDYMGEANNRWPAKGLRCGLLDFAGFPRGSFYMMKSMWADEDFVYLTTQTEEKSLFIKSDNGEVVEKKPGSWKQLLWFWKETNDHWNYTEGENIIVEVISGCPEVELFLDGESMGVKKLADFEDHIYKWAVPFSAGELKAVGKNGDKTAESVLKTAGEPASIVLTVDRATINADGYDVAHVVAQLVDADGNPVKAEEANVKFEIEGDCTNLGVDNGSDKNTQDHKADNLTTYAGRAMIILQSTENASDIKVVAKSGELKSNTIEISSN